MPILQEGALKFSFPATAIPIRFDGATHGLSHCMKAVDFIVEFPGFYLFVEVKDPDNTQATPTRRAQFASELTQPAFPRALSRKYRDSFVYRWAEKKIDKPQCYVVLLQLSTLQPAQYLAVDQALKRELPVANTPSSWVRPIAGGLAVLSVAQWNKLGYYGTIQRVPLKPPL